MSGFLLLKKLKVRRSKEIEPQEIFLDRLAEKKEEEIGIAENKVEVPLSQKIILGIFLVFIASTAFLLFETAYLQIVKADEYSDLARQNKFAIGFVNAERGVIYDINGKQLVFNKPSFDLVLNKEEFTSDKYKRSEILNKVSRIIGTSVSDLEEKIESYKEQTVILSENLSHESLVILQTKLNDFEGLAIENNSTRYYQDGWVFAHLIGYTGKANREYVGKEGIEKTYEEFLKENPGKIEAEKDVHGNFLLKKIISDPEPGKSLVLWVDSDLQKKAEEELMKILEKTGAEKGSVVALNPNTGGVLSLVSLPSYDNNLFTKGADQSELDKALNNAKKPLFNRAISGLYPSGSTIKPIIATAALEEKTISPSKKINDIGYIEIKNKYDPNIVYRRHGIQPHGWVDIRQAIAVSSNIYFYTVGGGYKDQAGLGPTRIKKYLELFGWGSKTRIDLPGEADGFIPSPEWKKQVKKEIWWDGDTYNMSIGQGDILITPIQIASSFAAIANGGTLYKPQVVKEIINENKDVVEEIKPEIINSDFVEPNSLKVVREGMRMAVTAEDAPHASSYSLNFLPVSAAAKTGTAETPGKNVYHNWITVFAPYENPEIVLTIMIENVPGVQAAALPAARDILQWYFTK